jgi:hypothetical protein
MGLAVRLAAALLVWPVLSGCTAAAPTTSGDERPQALTLAEARSDVGNDRPLVSFDGLMIRRRVVVAVHVAAAGDLRAIRRQFDRAAARGHTGLTPLPAGVLDPVPLERLAPDLVLALRAGATRADGIQLMRLVLRDDRGRNVIRRHGVYTVLVHDLRFTVAVAHPTELASEIAREGIVSDALGNYRAVPGIQSLDLLYTGPLLSDSLLHAVQVGIARPALVSPATVVVAPRSLAGKGVHLADEPTPTPVQISAAPHDHH